jgi:hypothetical protein
LSKWKPSKDHPKKSLKGGDDEEEEEEDEEEDNGTPEDEVPVNFHKIHFIHFNFKKISAV